ncbi:MAG TPA: biotin/lipoyl-binding protein, partial [Terriglobia bacterium]|nr:biotin/lipoyl-binding protein [Terriglobia bacterium]
MRIQKWGFAINNRSTLVHATGLSFLVVAAAISSSCTDNGARGDSSRPAQPVSTGVPVLVGKVSQKTVPVEVHVIGNGEAYSTVQIKSQVEGRVERVYFTEGQDVKKGDLLFTIDARPFQAALEQGQANLARDTAQEKNAEAQAERYAGLFKEGIVSKDQHDQFHTN